MAIKNAGMNRFAVEILNLQPQDQVLEIGFGHGQAIGMIAERTTNGFVAGIDLSDVMILQAAKRNQQFIKSGLVELSQASVADIPYEFARFNKVLAVNNYQFWPNAEHNLTEIQRVLSESGLLVLCLRLKKPGGIFQMAPGFTQQEIDEVTGLLRWVGFREVQLARRRVGYEAVCLIAKK
ncbi:MAG: methyltransferase domain-containing protein [Acidobacteria bacterium]|nr:methyltransferase domain-containing protein [Acidobacteriota bacterium]